MDDPTTESPPRAQTELDAEAQTRAASIVGRVISDRYRVDELLAMGGMGAVYGGTHLLLKKRIAIKILHPGIDNLPELVVRFGREAIAGAHVQHPSVAAATDFGTLEDGSYFLVLEYVKGTTLHQAIKRGGALSPERAARVARQIASALAAAHAIGIVHRDVKPRNIMLVDGPEGTAKLIDFGLAKVPVAELSAAVERRSRLPSGRGSALSLSGLGDPERITIEGVIFGTIAYLAPEAALGMDAVDERSDLYALGIVLYEMLAGKHPFDAVDATELFKQQRFMLPPPIAERAPGVVVPAALEAVMMRLLDKAPDLRYPSGEAVVEALDAALATVPAEPTPPSVDSLRALAPWHDAAAPTLPAAPAPGPERPARPARARTSSSLLIAGGAVCFAIGVGGVLLVARAREPATTAEPVTPVNAGHVDAVPDEPPFLAAPPSAARPLSTASPSLTSLMESTESPSSTASTPSPASSSSTVSAAPSPPPSAAAPAAALPSAKEAAFDSLALRSGLLKSARLRDWPRGGDALLGLIDHDPASLRRVELAIAARDVTAALDRENSAEKIFDGLTERAGTPGLDVLYDIVQARGGSHAALRSADILRQAPVLSRATPELRIAFRLREASCVDKIPLFPVAAKEGDGRALVVMETQGRACFKKSRELDAATKELKDRLIHGTPPAP